jgi:ABC-2 type transport system ATP-binding protein
MIELHGLTKRYGPTLAVDDLSFQVQPGKVTGFLGPNGAGKSTSMRMVLGLDRPTAGQALVDGRPYQALRAPLRVVGALLDAGAVHPRRSAHDHLLALARSNGIARSRVEEVLGLEDTADHLVVIGRGRLVADAPIGQIIAGSSHTVVRVRTPAAARLGRLLAPTARTVRQESDSQLTVVGLTTDDVGDVAHATGIRLHELTLQSASLEEAYMELSQHHLDYGTSQLTAQGA